METLGAPPGYIGSQYLISQVRIIVTSSMKKTDLLQHNSKISGYGGVAMTSTVRETPVFIYQRQVLKV